MSEEYQIQDDDNVLCKILTRETSKGEAEHAKCLEILKTFAQTKDSNKAFEELANILNVPKEKILDLISTSCIPCESKPTTSS